MDTKIKYMRNDYYPTLFRQPESHFHLGSKKLSAQDDESTSKKKKFQVSETIVPQNTLDDFNAPSVGHPLQCEGT